MGIRINTNVASLNAQRQLYNSTATMAKSMEKLSSGLRINRAGDDAAGLAISEALKSDIRAYEQASRNASSVRRDAGASTSSARSGVRSTFGIGLAVTAEVRVGFTPCTLAVPSRLLKGSTMSQEEVYYEDLSPFALIDKFI